MGPTDRVVVLIDMDCFYCQVEEKLNPGLKDKPIAVVQYNAWRGGGIIAVNYPAREQGVTRHMRGNEAKKKCPSINLVRVPEVRGKADLTKYRDAGKDVADVLALFTPLLQRASVDEAYLDITELVEKRMQTNLSALNVNNLANTFIVGCDLKDFLHNVTTNPEFSVSNLKLAVGGLIVEEIRHEVFKKTGYKCSAGIAHNKILAKLVCSLHKPDKQTILPQDAVAKFFETVQISKIKSLGGKFGQSLIEDFQITHMNQLATIPEKSLAQKYDEKTASWLYNVARGIDLEPVTTKIMSKSIACCKNFPGVTSLTTPEDVEHWLGKLSEEMSERLEKDLKENNRKAKQIVVSFAQEINKKDVHSSRTHPLISYDPKKIARVAFDVIKKNCSKKEGNYHLKFLGLSAGHFEDVKNVREITSFFQAGQIKRKSDSIENPEIKCSINYDDETYETVEEDIYQRTTQELKENIHELIFYDDSCRIKNDSNILQSINNNTEDINKSNEKSNIILDNQPTSSFFAKYFDDASNESSIGAEEERESLIVQNEEQNEENEISEVCSECNKAIPISDLLSHQDYHFALSLSKIQEIPQKRNTPEVSAQKHKTSNSDKKRGRSNSIKRKADNNSTLMTFFKKDEEADPTTSTETCPECNKKIKIEDISSHMDYHTAKKIHLEINGIKPSALPKAKSKVKNQTSNRSVASFFKPG